MRLKKDLRAIHIILDDGKKLISSINHLRHYVGLKSFERLSCDDFEEARHIICDLIKHLKRLSLEDIVPKNALISSEHFFSLLDFKSIKRKSIKNLKAAKHSLAKSKKLFVRQKSKKLYKWLGLAISNLEDAFYFLQKLNVRTNTAHDTAKTVQIQIQQEKKTM